MTPSLNLPASLRAESISAFCAGVEFAEARDLLHLVGRHRQADPPLDHVEHGLGGACGRSSMFCVASQNQAPSLRHILGDLDDVGREQRVLRDDVAFVRHVDDRAAEELVALGDVVHRVDEADVGDRELRVVALAGEGREIHDGDVGLGPRRAGRGRTSRRPRPGRTCPSRPPSPAAARAASRATSGPGRGSRSALRTSRVSTVRFSATQCWAASRMHWRISCGRRASSWLPPCPRRR